MSETKMASVRLADNDRPADVKAQPPEGFDPQKPHTWPSNPVDPACVRAGDLLMFSSYCTVKDTRSRPAAFADQPAHHEARVVDRDLHSEFVIQGNELLERAGSADQYDPTAVVPLKRQAIRDMLLHSHGMPFTVRWIKKDGDPRVLRGRFAAGPESEADILNGYVRAEDLDQDHPKKVGERFRKVAWATIEWMIIRGVKYVAVD